MTTSRVQRRTCESSGKGREVSEEWAEGRREKVFGSECECFLGDEEKEKDWTPGSRLDDGDDSRSLSELRPLFPFSSLHLFAHWLLLLSFFFREAFEKRSGKRGVLWKLQTAVRQSVAPGSSQSNVCVCLKVLRRWDPGPAAAAAQEQEEERERSSERARNEHLGCICVWEEEKREVNLFIYCIRIAGRSYRDLHPFMSFFSRHSPAWCHNTLCILITWLDKHTFFCSRQLWSLNSIQTLTPLWRTFLRPVRPVIVWGEHALKGVKLSDFYHSPQVQDWPVVVPGKASLLFCVLLSFWMYVREEWGMSRRHRLSPLIRFSLLPVSSFSLRRSFSPSLMPVMHSLLPKWEKREREPLLPIRVEEWECTAFSAFQILLLLIHLKTSILPGMRPEMLPLMTYRICLNCGKLKRCAADTTLCSYSVRTVKR